MGFRGEDDDDEEVHEEEEIEEEEEEEEEEDDEDSDEDYDRRRGGSKAKSGGGSSSSSKKKRPRNQFIDDVAEEDDDEEDDEEDDRSRKRRPRPGMQFIDDVAAVASDGEDDEEEEGEEDFIQDEGADLQDEEEDRRIHRRPFLPRDEQDNVEEMEKFIQQRYGGRSENLEYDEETTDVEQQALLPSVKDPKLWMVKCQLGHERELTVCLMQKFLDLQAEGEELQIKSVVALDHLKGYIYVESEKEAYVKQAMKGMRMVYSSAKVLLVPIKEMTDVLSVESKSVDLEKDTWVRVKIGIYKGDLAKVVDVDHVRQRVTIKLVPRIDLQALAAKLEGRVEEKKKAFVPQPRFVSIAEVKEMRIPVDRKRDSITGEIHDTFDGLLFKDGYHIKSVSMRTISVSNIQPTLDELQRFQRPGDEKGGDASGLSLLLANRKKGHFIKGDAVIVIEGDLRNLMGIVEKIDEDSVYVKPKYKDLTETLVFKEKQLCKYFNTGGHVKVMSGSHEGATGMVVKVDGHILTLLSDTTKEDIRVFADNVAESSEVTTGLTSIGQYELHDLVELERTVVGLIIRIETDGCMMLKGVPEKPEVVTVKLREMRKKVFDRRTNAQDCYMNVVSLNDIVRVLEGPFKGKQGPVQHIFRGVLFIHDKRHLENGGFICVRGRSCAALGGSRTSNDRNMTGLMSSFGSLGAPSSLLVSPSRSLSGMPPRPEGHGGRHGGGRRPDNLMGKTVKIRLGPFKGYRGRVVDASGAGVRIELESQMKVVTVSRDQLSGANEMVTTPRRESPRYGAAIETPSHPSRTPMHPLNTPMRDSIATPMHDGMRTPMRDRAWNPYSPMTPLRDPTFEDGSPPTWQAGTPPYQHGTPVRRAFEAPTPGSGWANSPAGSFSDAGTPRDSPGYANAPSPYLPSTPGGPMTPGGPTYLPGTPGAQPLTPGSGALEAFSPVPGASGHEDDNNTWTMPDIVVMVRRPGGESQVAVIKEVLPDGFCRIAPSNGGTLTVNPLELEVVPPKKSDKVKVTQGELRGSTGKLIGVDGADGIVTMDENLEIKILDMSSLARISV